MKLSIHHYSEVDSTQTVAKHYLLEGDADEGTVILADEQLSGSGRFGKSWDSPIGGLYCSLILKPHNKPIANYSQLAFVIAVGIQKALHSLLPALPLTLKWPNDILINAKKVGGILIEIEGKDVIIGMGINIDSHPEGSTHLNEYFYTPQTIDDVLKPVLKSVWETYQDWIRDGFEPLQTKWLKHAHQLGKALERDGIKGRFIGISTEGAMLLENESGEIQKITKLG
ncbi:MAG: biotin--[acetyl-CoA-carboxylase] ligase [Alphaproteobacteria bacterium]|nr:biotin--[acetyl-CoA-carboxylase] ligase [Alphaproteobacteria bacterium]